MKFDLDELIVIFSMTLAMYFYSFKVECNFHYNYALHGQLLFQTTQTVWRCLSIRLEYETRLLPRCIHHFKPNIINIMDHMRISGKEPSSVILSQTKKFESWKVMPQKCQIKLNPKGMV